MKTNIYLVGLAAFLGACSSPATENETSEPAVNVQEVAAEETSDPVANPARMEKSSNEDAAEAEVRQVEAHVHGGATLAIAVDGNSVTAELETPLYNLLGFEHAPETAEQKDAVEKAEKQLSKPDTLIRFNDEAGCDSIAVKSMTELFEHDDHDEDHHEHHEKDEHGHDDKQHDEKDHDEKDHEHDERNDHEDHSDHQDVVISYSFSCTAPENLTRLNADLLTAFPLMDELDVVYLGMNNQASFELTPSTPTADLRP